MKKLLAFWPLILALPGIGFWVVLVLWENDHRSGEHWEYLVAEYGLFSLTCALAIIAVLGAIAQLWRDRPSRFWWIAALVDLTPPFYVLWAFTSR